MADAADGGAGRAAIRAAGAVLWQPGPDGPEVALVHRPNYDDWSLPKGKTEPGEHVLLTAVREAGRGDRDPGECSAGALPSTHYDT